MNIFEQATRLKLRFAVGTRVNLTVENLWDLPLTNVKGEDLDHIAIELQEKLSTNEKIWRKHRFKKIWFLILKRHHY